MLQYIRLLSILLLLCNPFILYASSYDADMLNIFSKLMPRFILMSSLKKELDTTLDICLVHEEEDTLNASVLKNMIVSNYPNGIKNYTIKISDTSFKNMQNCQDAQLTFLFDTHMQNIQDTVKISQSSPMIIVSYSPELLESVSDISLFVGRRVIPFINAKNIQQKNIQLENILYRISKIYVKQEN